MNIINIVLVLVAFCLIVLVHEFGHFILAKMVGIKVEEFAVGMGPKIFGKKIRDTEYTLRAIPIGGFNKIPGMNPEQEGQGFFYSSKVGKRIPVLLAGSVFNLILAVIIFAGVYSYYGADIAKTELAIVADNKPAQTAGLMVGDKIIQINGQTITNVERQTQDIIFTNTNLNFLIERNGQQQNILVTKSKADEAVGITFATEKKDVSLIEATQIALAKTEYYTNLTIKGLTGVFISPDASKLSGPIGVFKALDNSAEQGMEPLLKLMALLSINIGIFNLLPIPLLDGGHIVICFYQKIIGRRPLLKEVTYATYAGVAVILTMAIAGTYTDISKLLG